MHKTRNAPAEVATATGDLRIRPARVEEADLLTDLSLRAKAVWGYDAGFLARCRAVMTVKAANIESRPHFVAELDDRLAGFYGFEPEATGIGLDYLFVEPDLIGRGIGHTLWNHAVATARRLGHAALIVVSDPISGWAAAASARAPRSSKAAASCRCCGSCCSGRATPALRFSPGWAT